MPCSTSSEEGFHGTGDPRSISASEPALLCVPTGDLTLETTVARVQSPVVPQPQLLTHEVSAARIIIF